MVTNSIIPIIKFANNRLDVVRLLGNYIDSIYDVIKLLDLFTMNEHKYNVTEIFEELLNNNIGAHTLNEILNRLSSDKYKLLIIKKYYKYTYDKFYVNQILDDLETFQSKSDYVTFILENCYYMISINEICYFIDKIKDPICNHEMLKKFHDKIIISSINDIITIIDHAGFDRNENKFLCMNHKFDVIKNLSLKINICDYQEIFILLNMFDNNYHVNILELFCRKMLEKDIIKIINDFDNMCMCKFLPFRNKNNFSDIISALHNDKLRISYVKYKIDKNIYIHRFFFSVKDYIKFISDMSTKFDYMDMGNEFVKHMICIRKDDYDITKKVIKSLIELLKLFHTLDDKYFFMRQIIFNYNYIVLIDLPLVQLANEWDVKFCMKIARLILSNVYVDKNKFVKYLEQFPTQEQIEIATIYINNTCKNIDDIISLFRKIKSDVNFKSILKNSIISCNNIDKILDSINHKNVDKNVDESCIVCMTNEKEMVFNCGHYVTCGDCSKYIFSHDRRCPICRQNISTIIKIFFTKKFE